MLWAYVNPVKIGFCPFWSLLPAAGFALSLMLGEDRVDAASSTITMLRLGLFPLAAVIYLSCFVWLMTRMGKPVVRETDKTEAHVSRELCGTGFACFVAMVVSFGCMELIQETWLAAECADRFARPWLCL